MGEAMKRLILLFDGTWNHDQDPTRSTNIFRLRELLEEANREKKKVGRKNKRGDRSKEIAQRIYYDEGVGTQFYDNVLGGTFGRGLSENVRQGYRYLAQFYEPGDEIYILGFSRGAFTARSLAGFLAASGLLTKAKCLSFAWKYYRTAPKRRYPADKAVLEGLCVPDVRIKFLGVFDTVGSLGIPFGAFRRVSAWINGFHDTKLGSTIDNAFQALAIDEKRWAYVPAPWAKPDHNANKCVQQV